MKTSAAIVQLLQIVESLRKQYPHKRFTLDGRLVGDLGEVIAEENYNLKLFTKVTAKYDGETPDGRAVQIKVTFHNTLGFPCHAEEVPDFYLGLKLYDDGSFDEVYNGPGYPIWQMISQTKVPRTNLYTISISRLSK